MIDVWLLLIAYRMMQGNVLGEIDCGLNQISGFDSVGSNFGLSHRNEMWLNYRSACDTNSCLLEPVYTGTRTHTRVYVNAP